MNTIGRKYTKITSELKKSLMLPRVFSTKPSLGIQGFSRLVFFHRESIYDNLLGFQEQDN